MCHSPGSPRMVTTTSAFPGVGRVRGGVITVPLVAAAASEWMGGTRSHAKAMRPEANPWSIGVPFAAPGACNKSSLTWSVRACACRHATPNRRGGRAGRRVVRQGERRCGLDWLG